MSIDLLFADFDRLIQSAESVHRLRRFILDLAVRGKLAPQDPNDEPASELLKRIAAEKARLVKAGAIGTGKILDELTDADKTFTVPEGWCWARLGNIATYLQRGKSPKYATGTDLLVVSQKCVKWNGLDLSVAKEIEAASLERYEGHRFLRDGDLLWNSTGTGTIGRIIRVESPPEKLVCDSHVTLIRCPHVVSEYLRTWLRSDHVYGVIESRAAGSTKQVELTTGLALNWQVPLPPLAEQHRIVAKVNELMALCDRLEAARADREATRDRLATASLASLNAPNPNPAMFQHNVAFSLNNLPPLTTRPDQINALRQSILNLAVRGKLVPQDAREDRSNQGKLRSDTTAETYDVRAFEGRMALLKRPDNWTIEPLSRVSSHIVDCLHTTPKWTEEGVLCIKTNQVRAGQLDLSSPHFVSENTHKTRVNRLEPRQDDILYIREGGVLGVACRVPSDTRLCLGQRLMQIRANNAIAPQFLELCLNSPWITEFAAEKTTGGAAPRVNMSIVRSYPIPLPPLGEQHRIVAKVDELKALCNRLEARLNRVGKTRGELVELLCARVA